MDECALLDLLECAVCLERLDASAKVLPCQHTFCRRCLLGIVSSRGELRCPECRTPVTVPVHQLPSNILLVRLLDGLRHRPRPSPASEPASSSGSTPGRGSPVPLQRTQSIKTTTKGVPQLPCARALYNYDGKELGDLCFSKGDIILLRRQVDENWYLGELAGVHGFFPTNFVHVLKPLPQPQPQGRALYNFQLPDKEADKDCLPFSKDDVLTVIRRVDENWAEGMLGDKIGIFPISYVEFNSAALQLMGIDQPAGVCDGVSVGGVKKNSKKRHSFTSVSTSGRAPQPVTHRHSMEISGPVLISSSNPAAAARIGELSGGLSSSAPSQVHICTTGLIVTPPPSSPVTAATVFSFPTESSYGPLQGDSVPPPPPLPPSHTGGQSVSASGGSEPISRQRPSVYVAVFPYSPRKDDELELRTGEMFLVLQRCHDGWFKGTSMHTGRMGVFPGNYMSPVLRSGSSVTQNKLSLGRSLSSGYAPFPSNSVGPECVVPVSPCPITNVPPISQQTKSSLGQMTVNQARNATRAGVCPLSDRTIATMSPVSIIASPNTTSVQGDTSNNVPNVTTTCRAERDSKREKKGLLKLLSVSSNKKKPRPSPPSSPTLECEQSVCDSVQELLTHNSELDTSPSVCNTVSSVPIVPPPRQLCSSLTYTQQDTPPIMCERYRVSVAYPAQSEAELELKEGDIVFVHKKREDGWFRGTLQRNGRTGLFPGSFVNIM